MVFKLQKKISSKKQLPLAITTFYLKLTFSEKNDSAISCSWKTWWTPNMHHFKLENEK